MSTERNMHFLKKRSIHKTLIIILLIGSIQPLFAQKQTSTKETGNKWFLGINGGVNLYWGDIKFNSFWPEPKKQEIQMGSGFILGRNISPALKLNSELNYVSLKGTEVYLADTLKFKTQALSFAIKGQLNPFAILTKKETKFALYIESGVGIMAWRSLLQNQTTNDTLNNLGWSNPNKEIGFFIPLGIKFEYQFKPRFSAYLINNYNLAFSDLLDGEAVGTFDRYSYSAFGINYFFGKQKTAPKLLPYNFFEITYDSIVKQSAEEEKKKPKKKEVVEEIKNPFSLNLIVPETSPHTGFDISINLAKTGVPANGFFRLLLPSGFVPQDTKNDNVIFTKLDYRYEYDFMIPMNQDQTIIPIHINLSEVEKGTYPILVEGEIVDQQGNIFPIKLAKYTKIISEAEWYQGLQTIEKAKINAIKAKEIDNKTIPSETDKKTTEKTVLKTIQGQTEKPEQQVQTKSLKGIYRIQIMASRVPHPDLKAYKAKHNITEELYLAQEDGWYRYNLYSTEDKKDANRLNTKVRSENGIDQAFVTYYENGKRILNPSISESTKASSTSKQSPSQKPVISTQVKESAKILDAEKLLYRIEIAIGYDQPIPLNLLQDKVGKEKISEFKQNRNFYYTVGEFEDLKVAQAFLGYMKTQYKLENAKIGQYQNDKRINVVF